MKLSTCSSLLWIFFAVLMAILSVAFIDQPLALWIQEAEYPEVKYWSREITNTGLATFYLGSSFILYLLSKWIFPRLASFKNKTEFLNLIRNWSGFIFTSFVMNGILVHIIKGSVGRQRPHLTATFEAHNFDPLTLDWYWQSMPSGHSQVMFTAATALSLAAPKYRWLFFTLATFIALTRVILHQHFLSDVIIGASIGIFATLILRNQVKLPLKPLI